MQKKQVALIGYDRKLLLIQKDQLLYLLGRFLDVQLYVIGKDRVSDLDAADIIITPDIFSCPELVPIVNKSPKNIMARYCLSKEDMNKIMNLPPADKCLVYGASKKEIEFYINYFYIQGIREIEFIAYSDQTNQAPHENRYDSAIIIGDIEIRNTVKISRSIKISKVYLDISTLVDIGARILYPNVFVTQDLAGFYKQMASSDFGLLKTVIRSAIRDKEMDSILGNYQFGIMTADREGLLYTCNEIAEKIIGYKKEDLIGQNVLDLFKEIPFVSVIESETEILDKVVQINEKAVVISVFPNHLLYEGKVGATVILNNFDQAERKQHHIRKQIYHKGHVAKYDFDDIIGTSELIVTCKEIASKLALSEAVVLISGETGTGKEMFAQAIHNHSGRKKYPFVAVNCGAFSENLLESELFGYEEGAFTGAKKGGKIGLFELAHRGTLFLDEISEIPLHLQTKLLRVLQERQVMKIGGDYLIDVDVRIIAATNKDLKEMVREGKFRKDLYYRLNVLQLIVPPLRERKQDIPVLMDYFQRERNVKLTFTSGTMEFLQNYSWDGNVRELENLIEYIITTGKQEIDVKDFRFMDSAMETRELNFDQEENSLLNLLKKTAGKYLDVYLFILRELAKRESGRGLGRRAFKKLADAQGMYISENKISEILLNLENTAMIERNIGRGGCRITPLGEKTVEFLQANK